MRASILIASHNEGELLWKTVDTCRRTCRGLDYEIIVADDASTDGCIAALRERFPDVTVLVAPNRRGVAPTKDLAAEHARGQVLVFVDAHCKPEEGAIERLVADVEGSAGEAVFTPTVVALDANTWENDFSRAGHGYTLNLDDISWGWIGLSGMRQVGEFWESPCLIGCCLAVSRDLYQRLWGFDREMYLWGVEDVDFGLKCWLMGHSILHDPQATIGHRFQEKFTTYHVADEHLFANKLRLARKTFAADRWNQWLDEYRRGIGSETWAKIWPVFCARRGSVEFERAYLSKARRRDEAWYVRQFGHTWADLRAVPEIATLT